MKSKVYEDYPEQPYISENRDIKLWEERPELFPYSKVEKKQMVRNEDGLLPGDIVLLWRIGFNNFTNETHIPDYFEYRYGINTEESIELLLKKQLIEISSVVDSLDLISSPIIKRILKDNDLKVGGKKQELVDRLIESVSVENIEKEISTRRYRITETGKDILDTYYESVIIPHGPKSY